MRIAFRFLCVAVLGVMGVAGVSQADPPASFHALLAADFDEDGQVSLNDFFLLAGTFGAERGEAGYDGRYDLNRDERIDLGDLFAFSDSFGKIATPSLHRPTVRLRDVLKKVSGPAFARVRAHSQGSLPERGGLNVTLIPHEIQETSTKTPAGMEVPMVKVPAGDFIMGSNAKELGLREDFPGDESPIHLVYLNSFLIDKHEVTNEAYMAFVKATGHRASLYQADPDFSGPGQPVIGVSWNDAMAYCNWRGMALPTEAQWEKAARGIDGRKYPWGNEDADIDANGLSSYDPDLQTLKANFNSRFNETFDAGAFPLGTSAYGAHDMAGNVWEWCMDWYDRDYYKVSPRENPRGPTVGTTRVVRGGAAHGDYDDIRAPYRGDMDPQERNEFVEDYVEAFNRVRESDQYDDPGGPKFQYRYFIGFRCVRETF